MTILACVLSFLVGLIASPAFNGFLRRHKYRRYVRRLNEAEERIRRNAAAAEWPEAPRSGCPNHVPGHTIRTW